MKRRCFTEEMRWKGWLRRRREERQLCTAANRRDVPEADAQTLAGLGTLIIEALAVQINATVAGERSAAGYEVTVTVPRRAAA
jgi:two-component sensor histidine kinase